MACTSPSSLRFWPETDEHWADSSLTRSLASLSSFSAPLRARSACSGAELLDLAGQDGAAALSHVVGLAGLVAGTGLVLDLALHLADGLLVFLDVLLQLGLAAVGLVQGNLELVDVLLKLLLDAQSLGLALGLGLQGSLDGLDGALVVAAGVLELLLLILDAAVDLRAHAGDLQLSAHDLGLLLLESRLGLLKGSLELFFLQLKTPAGLVQLVDVAASLAQLVGQVVDLVGEVLVLAAQGIHGVVSLLDLGLDTEELGRVAAGLLLAVLELALEVVALALPLSDGLVESTLFLLKVVGVGLAALNVNDEVLEFASQPALGLLQSLALEHGSLGGLLGVGELGLQLAAGLLTLVSAGGALLLELDAPLLHLVVGLGQLALQVGAALL